jgi:hypothetical protein
MFLVKEVAEKKNYYLSSYRKLRVKLSKIQMKIVRVFSPY